MEYYSKVVTWARKLKISEDMIKTKFMYSLYDKFLISIMMRLDPATHQDAYQIAIQCESLPFHTMLHVLRGETSLVPIDPTETEPNEPSLDSPDMQNVTESMDSLHIEAKVSKANKLQCQYCLKKRHTEATCELKTQNLTKLCVVIKMQEVMRRLFGLGEKFKCAYCLKAKSQKPKA